MRHIFLSVTKRRFRKLSPMAGLLLAPVLVLLSAAPAAALTTTPLPASEYSVRPLCGTPGPGHAACFSLELVPQTAAARARSTPLGMTLHHAVEPNSAAGGSFGLRPQDLHGAYGLPTKAPVPQTIAIVDAYDDPTAEADLAAYDAEFGLPACTHANGCFTKVNQEGDESPLPASNSGWAAEIALDVESAHAICQENCRILLVEANSASTAALEVAENTAVRLGATEISNSFGGPEPVTEGTAFDHPGIVVTASTGDDGYLNWTSSAAGFAGHANYPASSPHVVAVGGTRVHVTGSSWTGESVWNDGSTVSTGFGAGGGGCSAHPNAQTWQQRVPNWAEVGCGEKRAAADVAADGDPYSGIAVYQGGHWSTVGGTSLASPIIASTFALAGGSGGVSYPAETLYAALGSSSLHDITEGSNGECTKAFDPGSGTSGCTTAEEEQDCADKLICRAAAGYDGPTGVGTPNGTAAFAPPTPTVSTVSPAQGDLGTSVTIAGEHLAGVAAVKFGTASATGVVEDSATELTVTAPTHEPGQVDVTVTTGGGTSATSSSDQFTYLSNPAVASVTPSRGTTGGGTAVTIVGARLNEVEVVEFGGVNATHVVEDSATEVTVTTPAHAPGQVDVTVRTPHGSSEATALDRFTYVSAPTVTAVEPGRGTVLGGTTVTVKGTNLGEASAVEFGAASATNVVEDSATELTVTSPAHAEGRVDVTVTTPGGTSTSAAADEFEYLPLPVVEAVEPSEGPLGGGTLVIVTGHDLDGATSVSFGAVSGTALDVRSSEEIAITSPAHAAGAVDVTVTGPAGSSNAVAADRFTYVAAPASTSLPTITGYPMEGRTLTEAHGGWQNSPTSYEYKWLRCDSAGASCSAIDGAAAQTYKLAAADVGHTIRVEETAANAGGQAAATSTASGEVVAKASQPFTWTGGTSRSAGATADTWTTSGNWEGGTAPSEALDIGTLTLPSLADEASCENIFSQTDVCYQSRNDIAGVEVEKLSVDDRYPYILYGEPLTLGAGGVEAFSSNSEENVYVPSLRLPVTLGADQAWTVEGTGYDASGIGGLELPGSISGESHSLAMELSEESVVATVGSPNDEVGPVTIRGADAGKSGWDSSQNGLLGFGLLDGEEPSLNATDGNPVRLEHVAMLGRGTTGPLTVDGGELTVAQSNAPYGKLEVNGPLSLDSATVLDFTFGEGETAGEDYPQLQATGDVDLGGARLSLIADLTYSPGCPQAPAGSEIELVKTSGQLEGTFGNAPQGTRFDPCVWAEGPVLEISYTDHAVVAKSLGTIPYEIGPPDITGLELEGQTLMASPGAWWNNPTFSYQWLRCDSSGANCAAISGQTGTTYVLGPADVGYEIEVEVVAENGSGSVSATSEPTAVVTPPVPQLVFDQPAVGGDTIVGETVVASQGQWTYNPTFTYQWLRCDSTGANCAAIPGATEQLYRIVAADLGHTLEVEVHAHNGISVASATSPPSAVVAAASPPANIAPPTISGGAIEGEPLSAGPGGWERARAFTYQWLRCDSGGGSCSPVAGATTSSYTLTSADVGHRIEVAVTTEDAAGPTTANSAPTAVIAARSTGGGAPTGGGTPTGSFVPTTSAVPTGGSGGRVVPPPAAGTALVGGSASVKGGKAAVALSCTGPGPCTGTLELTVVEAVRHGKHRSKRTVTIGSAGFSIAASASGVVQVHLTAAGQALLRKAGAKGLKATLAGSGVKAGVVRLKPAKQGKKKRHRSARPFTDSRPSAEVAQPWWRSGRRAA